MKKRSRLFYLAPLALTSLLIFGSCSGNKKEREASEAISALIEGNKNIVSFGHADVYGIIDKTGYKTIPKVNVVLGSVIDKWKSGIDIEKPIYFAMEAPFDNNGNPRTSYALLNIKNQDSLKSVISEMGYSLEKDGDITYYQENDVTFGMRNDLLIVLAKGGDYDGKAEIKKAFIATEGDLASGKAEEILDQEGDIVTGINFERTFAHTDKSVLKINEKKKDELKNLLSDAYIQTVAKFENGQATIESKNLFSEDLKNTLFFKDNNGNTLVKQLGGGNPWMGLAVNTDLRKMEEFLSNYFPETRKDIVNMLPTEVNMALMSLGDNPLSKLFSGQLGFVSTGDAKSALGMEFQFASFLGLGQKGSIINELVDQEFADKGTKKGDTYFLTEEGISDGEIKNAKNGIYAKSGNVINGAMNLPEYAKNFGQNSFSLFIAFDRMDIPSLELEDEMKALELLKYLTIDTNRDGGKLTIGLKKNDKNILKQIAEHFTNQMIDQIDGMGI